KHRRQFLRLCQEYGSIKAWFSGHFHLSHDYEDSTSTVDGCLFVQVGVIGEKSTRDGRRQTRVVRGTDTCLKVYTVSHQQGGDSLRLDVTINYNDPTNPIEAHGHEDYDHSSWFSAFVPQEEDGCYLPIGEGGEGGVSASGPHDGPGVVCWWHMEDGRVLGVHDGMLVEYDAELLAPVGVVRDREQMRDREVGVETAGGAVALLSCTAVL
ncbi:unnamed protein product, partial [Discosporangium mesarthrocarpum]